MRRGWLRGIGLLFSVSAVAACTPAATAVTPRAERADVAVPSYAPPSGTPEFCALLAGTTRLTDVPAALGTLAADPGDIEAGLTMSAAIDELQGVVDRVPVRAGYLAVGTSLEQLITSLRTARDGQLTDSVRTSISMDLDEVGRQAQTLCGFPT